VFLRISASFHEAAVAGRPRAGMRGVGKDLKFMRCAVRRASQPQASDAKDPQDRLLFRLVAARLVQRHPSSALLVVQTAHDPGRVWDRIWQAESSGSAFAAR
jgi:hypothetical protein